MLSRLWKTPPWKNADWRVREQAVSTLADAEVLLDLAKRDDVVEVRIAAARALPDDALKLRVVREARCERTRREAIAALRDASRVLACVFDRTLPVALREHAVRLRPLAPDDWLRLAAPEEPEAMRAFVLEAMPADVDVQRLWDSSLPQALKLVLLARLTDTGLLRTIYETETTLAVRQAAVRRIDDERVIEGLFYREEDIELREALAGQVHAEDLLFAMMDDEREPRVRCALVRQMRSDAAIRRVVLNDQDPQVRIAGVQRATTPTVLLEVAVADGDRRVRVAALQQASDDALRGEIARRSGDEQLRLAAVQAISSPDVLESLCAPELPHDLQWNAGRRLGRFPIAALAGIRSDWMLAQTAAQDADETVRETAARMIRQRETLEALARTVQGAARIVVDTRLREIVGTAGIRFVPVPGRPYAVSAFPITRGQVRVVMGDTRGNSGDDANLPATGMTPREVAAFCLALNQIDQLTYRLPSFEEWRHFTLADQPAWFRELRLGTAGADDVARIALHTGAESGRGIDAAWPNPWGILDALGNVVVWVEDQIGDASWIRYLQRDPLAEGQGSGADARAEDFSLAAGFSWSDRHVRMDRSDRLVRLAALTGPASDRVGFRLLRSGGDGPGLGKPFKLTLQPEPRWGLSREAVTEAVAATKLFTAQQMEQFWRVAPIMIQSSTNYESLRPMKRRLELCGLHVAVTV